MNGPRGVARLEAVSGETFPTLRRTRERTERELVVRRERLAGLEPASRTSVVLVGSWGRHEATIGSDDDFMVLLDGTVDRDSHELVVTVAQLLGDNRPGPEDIFGKPVSLRDLLQRIGREEDANSNLTRRMLLMLESVSVFGDELHVEARRRLFERYLEAGVKNFRPPRFLLNDLVRYWRTIAVDFEGKMRERSGEGWGLRNAKLRLSRKGLFAGGLLPVLECHGLEADRMLDHLCDRMSAPPLDRLAEAFLEHGMVDSGLRALRAYDAFLALLDNEQSRLELTELHQEDREDSQLFSQVAALGDEFEMGLLALLLDDPDLARLVREYLIF